jgi:hypothetical protein
MERLVFHVKGVRWVEQHPNSKCDPHWHCIYSPEIKAWNERMRERGVVLVLLIIFAALVLFLAGCENLKNSHGKAYVNGSMTQDANGQTSSSVTGGVEVDFAKRPHRHNTSGK